MSPYNISVVKPEDEKYYNALQLQPTGFSLGHHSGPSSCPEEYIVTSGRNGYAYPYNSTSSLINASPTRPQFTPLPTGLTQLVPEMQGGHEPDAYAGHRRYSANTRGFTAEQSSSFQPSLHGWMMMSNHFTHPNSPSTFMSGSPMSQGLSPLTPNTPLSTVGPSPSVSSLPSPGSQGSNDVLRLAPSPIQLSNILTAPVPNVFRQQQAVTPYYHQHVSETQLSMPQMADPLEQQRSGDYMDSASYSTGMTRRHSHSGLQRPLHYGSPMPSAPHLPRVSAPARPRYSHEQFNEIPLITQRQEYKFEGWSLPGPIVPQTTYQPHTASDRRRYVEQTILQPTIYFKRLDPVGLGISLVDCMTLRFRQLEGHDDEPFEVCGPSISIRLNWEGYEPWSRQIPTKNFKVPAGPTTRKQLAKNIAKTVQRFIDDHIDRPVLPGASPSWQVGPGKVEFKDLVLLSIHHVSKGSWQANLCLNRPLEEILNRSLGAR